MKGGRKKLVVLICLLLVSSMVLTTTAASAKKPPKPPGGGGGGPAPTGTVYYVAPDDNDEPWTWTMEPDGSSRTKVHRYYGGMAEMSRSKHGAHWWYLGFKVVPGTYPDGQDRQEIVAIRDDNGRSVQLTNDATLATTYLSCRPIWGPGDAFVSWSAHRWMTDASGDHYVDDGGIYKASISFDGSGDVTGLGTIGLVYETGTWYSNPYYFSKARENHDWSPDGTKVVYTMVGGTLHIYDTVAAADTALVSGHMPQWSPDGSTIAFTKGGSLAVIGPDGTGEKTIVEATDSRKWDHSVKGLDWSPDGNHIAYTYWIRSTTRIQVKISLHVVGNDGSDNTCVSNGMEEADWKHISAWR